MISLIVTLLLIVGMMGGAALAEEAKWDTTKQDEIVLPVMNNYCTQGWRVMAEKYMERYSYLGSLRMHPGKTERRGRKTG